LLTDFLLGHRFAFHKFFEFLNVFVAVVANTSAFTAIAAGTACFLVVAFERFGNVVMHYEAYIGFVYTHAEGNGSYNDIYFLHEEFILSGGTGSGIEAGMVR